MWSNLRRDIVLGLRSTLKRPAYSLPVIITLALGIGANVAVFSLVNAILLRPLDYQEPERLVTVWQTVEAQNSLSEGSSIPDFFDWREQSTVFEDLAAYRGWEGNLIKPGEPPERVLGAEVSASFFPMLGVQAEHGRTFSAAEDQEGGPRLVVLSHGLWTQRFSSDPAVVDRSVTFDGLDYRVVGVLPESFVSPAGFAEEAFFPLQDNANSAPRGVHDLLVFGRLNDGVGLDSAQAEMDLVAQRLATAYPDDNAGRGARVESLFESVVGDFRRSLWILQGAVLVVLLIACANVANLMLARALERRREVAIRNALGAGSGVLVRQFLVEGLVLAFLGGLAGLFLARLVLNFLLVLRPEDLPRLEQVGIDGGVLGFALLVTTATGLLCSLMPLLLAARPDLRSSLGESESRSTAGGGRAFLRGALVATELALAVVLVIGAGLLIKSFWTLQDQPLGFEPEGVLTAEMTLSPTRYPFPDRSVFPQWPEMAAFYPQLREAVEAVPGVEAVAIAVNHPLNAGWTTRVTFDDRPAPPPAEQVEVRIRAVSPGYLDVTGTPLQRGRALNDRDGAEAPPVLMVNESFAEKFYPGRDPVGERVSFWGQSREIVGVVDDVKFLGLGETVPPAAYPPFLQTPMAGFFLAVKVQGEPMAAEPALRRAVWSVDPQIGLYNIESMEGRLAGAVAEPRFNMLLLSGFALLALVLAAVGVYGLMAYTVEQRTVELGIRMALGGQRGDILRLVATRGLQFLLVGVVVGVAVALTLSHLLADLLYGVDVRDPWVFFGVCGMLLLVGLLACAIPSLRATRIDPQIALRYE